MFPEEEQTVLPRIIPPKQIYPLIVQHKVTTDYGTSKIRFEFEETNKTLRMRENLLKINKALLSELSDIEIDNEEIYALQSKWVYK